MPIIVCILTVALTAQDEEEREGALKENAYSVLYAIQTKVFKTDMSTGIWSKSQDSVIQPIVHMGEKNGLHSQYHNRWKIQGSVNKTLTEKYEAMHVGQYFFRSLCTNNKLS